MKPRTLAPVLLLCLVIGGAVAALAQSTVDPDRFFGLEWAGGERRGRPNVNGYIVNNYRVRAANMRLVIDSLDAGGKVIDTTSGFVADVPPGARVYFEVAVKQKAPRYRVTITGWEWRESGQ
jgi:acyl dehydratase